MNTYHVDKVIKACTKCELKLNHQTHRHLLAIVTGVKAAANARASDGNMTINLTTDEMYVIGDEYAKVATVPA